MDEARVRRALTLGPVVAVAGIAWVAVVGARGDSTTLPSVVVLAGLGLSIWGTHHFGRLGPAGASGDEGAPEADAAAAPPPAADERPPGKRKRRRKDDASDDP